MPKKDVRDVLQDAVQDYTFGERELLRSTSKLRKDAAKILTNDLMREVLRRDRPLRELSLPSFRAPGIKDASGYEFSPYCIMTDSNDSYVSGFDDNGSLTVSRNISEAALIPVTTAARISEDPLWQSFAKENNTKLRHARLKFNAVANPDKMEDFKTYAVLGTVVDNDTGATTLRAFYRPKDADGADNMIIGLGLDFGDETYMALRNMRLSAEDAKETFKQWQAKDLTKLYSNYAVRDLAIYETQLRRPLFDKKKAQEDIIERLKKNHSRDIAPLLKP